MASALIIDWPSQEVPRALLVAGFDVFSANLDAGTASRYGFGQGPAGDGVEVLPPQRDGDPALTITRVAALPERIEVVALHRPAAEHARIAQRAVELGARTVWVQAGTLADDARRIVAGAAIAVVEETPVHDAVRELARLA